MFGHARLESDTLHMIWSSSDAQIRITLRELLKDCGGIEERYLIAGTMVGEMLSYSAYGAQPSRKMLRNFVAAERAYVESGYEPLTIDDFVQLGGWGNSPGDRFKKAAALRPAVLPAAQYVEELRRQEPTVFDRLGAFLQRRYGGK